MSKHPFQNFIVRHAASEPIFHEQEPGSTMYIVQSGRIGLYRTIDGTRREIACMEKGDFFGEMSILEGLPRTSSAVALEDSELIEINSLTFDKMIKGNIEIAIRMLRKLSIRLREAERRLFEFQASGIVASSPQPASAPAPGASGGSDRRGLRLETEDAQTTFALGEQETLIGRYDPVTEMMPDVDLSHVDLKRSVSRRHARVLRVDDGYVVVEEVGALNGTFVNGNRLVTGQAHPLCDGDQLSLGTVKVVFRV
jgi:CRP-like cAMP-binding protein